VALGEVVERMGWILYAYVLMGNHYHLVFKTPEANLVKGMTWFQGTVTKRYNARHRQRGHLFSGRYKAVLVEQNYYLTTLVHYVHLNPVRAKLVRIADGIESYPWSSLADYTSPPTRRRKWLSVEAGLLHMGYPDRAEGRRQFLSTTESLIDRSRLVRAGIVEMEGAGLNTTLRRGWCFGSDEFKEKMSDKLGAMIPEGGYKLENGYCGKQLRDQGGIGCYGTGIG
jgi:putative transposase